MRTIEKILDRARWAPSGDNTQPWRFDVLDDLRARVLGHDTRAHCVYDLDGWASRLSIGAMLETASIAASALGQTLNVTRAVDAPETTPTFLLEACPTLDLPADPLAGHITDRSVQRRRYATTPLTDAQKSALAQALGPDHEVHWLEGPDRRRMASLMFRSARLRLITPEAYQVHSSVIEWGARFSADRVPDLALGVPRPMLAMMRTAMQSWPRVQFFNRYLAGTWMPRIMMDWLPALSCGAHFALLARRPAQGLDADFAAGRAMQRFWLTATRLGLCLQPEMTPLIFARYARQGRRFSAVSGSLDAAARIGQRLAALAGPDIVDRGVFLGRVGTGPAVEARSLRLEMPALGVGAPRS